MGFGSGFVAGHAITSAGAQVLVWTTGATLWCHRCSCRIHYVGRCFEEAADALQVSALLAQVPSLADARVAS